MKLIGTCKYRGREYIIERNETGFCCKVNGVAMQKHLTAMEVIRWLLHLMNDEM